MTLAEITRMVEQAVTGAVNHDDMIRASNDNTSPSKHTIPRSVSTAQSTFGRHGRARSSAFGHSSVDRRPHLEIPSKGTSGRHDSRRESI